jgi:hypothetical protein
MATIFLEKKMNFDVFGPFKLTRKNKFTFIRRNELKNQLRELFESESAGLSSACGCYIFAIKTRGGGIQPWYVGQANNQSFINEVITDGKILNYQEAMHGVNGSPVIYLLPARTPANKFCKPTKKDSGRLPIHLLENWLISLSLQKNSKLINKSKTKWLKETYVKGIFNPKQGDSSHASSELRTTLGLGKSRVHRVRR